jgi:hypothetical protein
VRFACRSPEHLACAQHVAAAGRGEVYTVGQATLSTAGTRPLRSVSARILAAAHRRTRYKLARLPREPLARRTRKPQSWDRCARRNQLPPGPPQRERTYARRKAGMYEAGRLGQDSSPPRSTWRRSARTGRPHRSLDRSSNSKADSVLHGSCRCLLS